MTGSLGWFKMLCYECSYGLRVKDTGSTASSKWPMTGDPTFSPTAGIGPCVGLGVANCRRETALVKLKHYTIKNSCEKFAKYLRQNPWLYKDTWNFTECSCSSAWFGSTSAKTTFTVACISSPLPVYFMMNSTCRRIKGGREWGWWFIYEYKCMWC